MSDGLNRVTLFGNLGVDPELRTLPSGRSLLKMRLATNESWINKEGVREERTEWHHVVMWGPRAEGLARILRKGSFLLVEGQIRTTSYEKDGEKRYFTDIHADNIVLGGRRASYRSAPILDEPNEHDSPFVPDEARDRDAPEPAPMPAPQDRTPPPEDGGGAHIELPPARPARKKTRSPASAPTAVAA
jgi:single-strand DNA-binding protein